MLAHRLAAAHLAAIGKRDDGRVRLVSQQMDQTYDLALNEIGPGNPSGWGSYAAGVLGLLAQSGQPVTGADVLVSSDLAHRGRPV